MAAENENEFQAPQHPVPARALGVDLRESVRGQRKLGAAKLLSASLSIISCMARQAGYYEWDDDLTPGKKKGGGWSQNLYDPERRLKGSARFVPTADLDNEPIVITETVYVPAEERRCSEAQEALAQAAADIVMEFLRCGIEVSKPFFKQFWHEKVAPFFQSTADSRRHRRRAERRSKKKPRTSVKTTAEADSPSEDRSTEVAAPDEQSLMSSAEAKARLIAAAAARAYSDEQLRLVTTSRIVDADSLEDVRASLARLSREELSNIVENMVCNPRFLEESSLAELAAYFGRSQQVETVSADNQ